MKSLLFTSIFILIYFLSAGQKIADIKVSNACKLTVLDSEGNHISSKYLSAQKQLAGFSSTIIVVKSKSGRVTVYDQEFKHISTKYISKEKSVNGVTGNNIIIKSTSGKVTTYDKNFRFISSRYE